MMEPQIAPEAVGDSCPVSRREEYELLMNSLNVSVSKHMLDEHFTVVWANEYYYHLFGYTREEYEALFHNQCDLFYADNKSDWEALVAYVTQVFSSGAQKYERVCRMRHRDGRLLWIKLVGTRINEYVDGCQLSYTVMMDITEQMQTLVEQEATYDNFPGLISKFRVREDGFYFLSANDRYFEVFHRADRYLFRDMTEASGLSAIAALRDQFRRGEPASFSIFQDDVHGSRVYMDVSAQCVDWIEHDPVYLLLHSDMTKLTQQNAELERLAFSDLVTGGMNGARFDRAAADAIRSAPAGTYVLVWLNLQKFKLINDLAGNAAGSDTLRYIHGKLQAHLQPGELVARTAADNYSLLLYNGDDAALSGRLREMAGDINSFNEHAEFQYFLFFTAGLCRVDDPALEITQLQDRANLARKEILEAAGGSLCVCKFYSEVDRAKLLLEKDLENRMRPALHAHEFQVYLQPKLSLTSHTVEGAEALVRWNDPVRGLIPPDNFIPLFERNGFILQLDLYMLEAVCALVRRWLDQGRRVSPISINVSRLHFSTPHFVAGYAEVCRRHGVPTSLIELEVTETMVFEYPEPFARTVEQMHRHGFTCSMDDFGSGYSSLNTLKDIHVDVLKLDRAFFGSERMDDPRERDVISSVVDLAKKLNMKTVAEGVETHQQQRFLEGTGCDLLQGYVFSRPVPVADYERLVYGGT